MQSLTLSELCATIEDALSMTMPDQYWVRAEIASLSDREHCYMDLVEKGPDSRISAKMQATCWSNVWHMLSPYFMQSTGQQLQVGMQVLLLVEVVFHPFYGLKINIIDIDPSYTLGAMALQRQMTIEQLQKDGVIDLNHSLELPSVIRNIAVISSDTAAGYGDFNDQLHNNSYGLCYKTELFTALMQGNMAAQSMIKALSSVFDRIEEFDCVVIIRGGGASTDLGCFDDYNLASHCAQFPLPILSGVGHTKDVSILDMVAHTPMKTPTAVAEFLIQHNKEQLDRIEDLQKQILLIASKYIEVRKNWIEILNERLQHAIILRINKEKNHLDFLQQSIALRSPEKIYSMGYTLTTVNGKIIRSINEVEPGNEIVTELKDGKLHSVVR